MIKIHKNMSTPSVKWRWVTMRRFLTCELVSGDGRRQWALVSSVDVAFVPFPHTPQVLKSLCYASLCSRIFLSLSIALAQTMSWFRAYFCNRGRDGPWEPVIVILPCINRTVLHEGVSEHNLDHILEQGRLPGRGGTQLLWQAVWL